MVEVLAYDLAQSVKPMIEYNKEKYIVTYAPRTRKAILKYGYDHMEVLSRRVAELLELPWAKLIVRHSGKEQKTLTYAERLKNIDVSFNHKNKLDEKASMLFLWTI